MSATLAALLAVAGLGFLSLATVLPWRLARRPGRTAPPRFQMVLDARAALEADLAAAERRRSGEVAASARRLAQPGAGLHADLAGVFSAADAAELDAAFHRVVAANEVVVRAALAGTLAALARRRTRLVVAGPHAAPGGTGLELVFDDATRLVLAGPSAHERLEAALHTSTVRLVSARCRTGRWELCFDTGTGLLQVLARSIAAPAQH